MIKKNCFAVFFCSVIINSYPSFAMHTEMDLVPNSDTGKFGVRGVALQFKHYDGVDPGNPVWTAQVRFSQGVDEIFYVPIKMGSASAILAGGGSLLFPPLAPILIGGAIGSTVTKYAYNKADISNRPSKVEMLYYSSNPKNITDEEAAFTTACPGQQLSKDELPFIRKYQRFEIKPPYMHWASVPFNSLSELVEGVDRLKVNPNSFPDYTVYGASYFKDALHCATFCVRFLDKLIPGTTINNIPKLKVYTDHANVNLKTVLYPAKTEYIIDHLRNNTGNIGNPIVNDVNIEAYRR